MLAIGPRGAPREVHDRHVVDLGRREVVHAHRLVGMRDGAEERDEQAHLGAAVEPGVAGERPRDAAQIEGAEEGVGVAVRAHEHRDVLVAPHAGLHLVVDHRGDGVRLLRGGLVVEVHGFRSGGLAHRGEMLGDRGVARFEAIRIVVPDEPVRAVEDRLVRSIVLGEHDARRVRIVRDELFDVRERRASKPIDCLVIIEDDRDVAVPRRQQLHHLELRVVRVLELVDQDVAEAPLVGGEHVRPRAEEIQREDDLVAEVHRALARHQLLVARERRRELRLLRGAVVALVVRRPPPPAAGAPRTRGTRPARCPRPCSG